MAETAKTWAPLEWQGIDSHKRALLDRVILDASDGSVVVSDASSGTDLFRVGSDELGGRSIIFVVLDQLGKYYCTGCTALLDGPMCTSCDKDRAKRLEATIALLEESDD